MVSELDLDVSSPDEVAFALRAAADLYREYDEGAHDATESKVWRALALIMERAAKSVENAAGRLGE